MARIVFKTTFNATPKEIVHALDTQQGIAGWWTEQVEFAGGVGAAMSVGFPGRAPLPFELRVEQVTENTVALAGGGTFRRTGSAPRSPGP